MKMKSWFCCRSTAFASLLLSLALGLSVSPSCAQDTLFTTQEDFTGWGGSEFTIGIQTSPDIDGSTTNGLGNTSDAGGVGTGGSLNVVSNGTSFNYFFSQGEQGNPDFISSLGTSGEILVDYIRPTDGDYFQLGLLLNYNGHFDDYFGSETDNGNGTHTATIPYTFVPGDIVDYFQLGLVYNSNALTPFTVDNLRVNAVPEPTSLILLGSYSLLLIGSRRKRC